MPVPLVAVGAIALCLVNIGLIRSSPVFYEIYVRIVYSKYMRTIRDQERNPYIRQLKIQNEPSSVKRFDETYDWENDDDENDLGNSGEKESRNFILRQVFAIKDILRDILGHPLRR